jgi:uncharacterized membrane protein
MRWLTVPTESPVSGGFKLLFVLAIAIWGVVYHTPNWLSSLFGIGVGLLLGAWCMDLRSWWVYRQASHAAKEKQQEEEQP